KPESIGLHKNKLVMGKHSGRAAFKDKLKDLNLNVSEEVFQYAFEKFKELADKKKEVFDDDIIAIVDDRAARGDDQIKFDHLEVHCGSDGQHAKVCLTVKGKQVCVESQGQGPIDAIFKSIKQIVDTDVRLTRYEVSAVTEG